MKETKYRSKFNYWLILIHAFVAIGALIVGFTLMHNGELFSRVVGIFFLLFLIVLVIGMKLIKQVESTL